MAKENSTRRRGRPSRYSHALAERICRRLADGETLRAICRDDDMPHESTVRNWAQEDRHGFFTQYARARDIGLDVMADELLDIADDGTNDYYETDKGPIFVHEHVQRSRLRVDARKWYLSKMAPKRYGEKLAMEHSGEGGGAIRIQVVYDDDGDG